jgi:hypothetical protein
MTTLIYILAGVSSIALIVILRKLIKNSNRKSTYKDWKSGDMLILDRYNGDVAYKALNASGKTYAKLCGWSMDSVYVDVHDGSVYKIDWSEVKLNKSATWRKNYEEAKKVMGTNPDFSPEIVQQGKSKSSTSSTGGKIDGKEIDLLSEVECQVYLKLAIEEEDYQSAELIRKRMEHFR